MILRLELPFLSPAVDAGRVAAWYKAEGETVGFGDDICDVDVEDVTRIRRPKSARHLAIGLREPKRTKYWKRRGVAVVRYRVTCAEQATLRRIVGAEGSQVEKGQLLALLSTEPDEPIDGPNGATLRVVANVVHPTGEAEVGN